jgi:acyl carrier protein
MTVSSRTPEGLPNQCPVCGKSTVLDPSSPPGDAPCPSCGHLLWWFQEHLSTRFEMERSQVTLDTSLTGSESLDLVELVMELEEEFDLTIPDEFAAQIQTVKDAILFIERYRQRKPPPE